MLVAVLVLGGLYAFAPESAAVATPTVRAGVGGAVSGSAERDGDRHRQPDPHRQPDRERQSVRECGSISVRERQSVRVGEPGALRSCQRHPSASPSVAVTP